MNQPQDQAAHPFDRARHPEYVIELWVSAQLRDRIRRNNAALAHDHEEPARRRGGRKAEPQAELEAEP
jgi:hypothetical protein